MRHEREVKGKRAYSGWCIERVIGTHKARATRRAVWIIQGRHIADMTSKDRRRRRCRRRSLWDEPLLEFISFIRAAFSRSVIENGTGGKKKKEKKKKKTFGRFVSDINGSSENSIPSTSSFLQHPSSLYLYIFPSILCDFLLFSPAISFYILLFTHRDVPLP